MAFLCEQNKQGGQKTGYTDVWKTSDIAIWLLTM